MEKERRRGMVRDGSEWFTLYRLEGEQKYGKWKGGEDQGGREWFTLYRLEGGHIWKGKEGEEWGGRRGWKTDRKWVNHGKEECQMFCEHL